MQPGGPPALEALLRRDRLITAAGLVALCALSWFYLLSGAGMGMSLADMTRIALFPHEGAAAAAMPRVDMAGMAGMTVQPSRVGPELWLLTAAMWCTMMIAIMAPAAAPTILLYARVHRHAVLQDRAQDLLPTGAFAAGYLLVWLAFSVAAAGLQAGLQASGLLSATLGSQTRWLSGAVLIAAGLYHLSPLQGVCLNHCRSPAAFSSRPKGSKVSRRRRWPRPPSSWSPPPAGCSRCCGGGAAGA